MRITHSMLFRTSLSNLDQQRAQLARTQEQASSGLRINRPSDDPLGAGSALMMRASGAAIQQLQRNASSALARATVIEDALAGVGDVLIRARELAIQGANGTLDDDTRQLVAREVEGLHATLLSSANTRFGGAHLFAGFASDAPPFEAAGGFVDTPPSAPNVTYVGDSGEVEIAIEEGVTARVSFDGRRVFLGDGDGNGAADPGRENLFDVLGSLRNALMSGDTAAISTSLDRIDTAATQVSAERTIAGNELGRIEDATRRLATRDLRNQERLSQVQDADLARVISDLVQQETALQAGLSAMGRLLPPTLMDFLN